MNSNIKWLISTVQKLQLLLHQLDSLSNLSRDNANSGKNICSASSLLLLFSPNKLYVYYTAKC